MTNKQLFIANWQLWSLYKHLVVFLRLSCTFIHYSKSGLLYIPVINCTDLFIIYHRDARVILVQYKLFSFSNICKMHMLMHWLFGDWCVVLYTSFSFSRAMSSAATTPPSVDKVDGFSRKSVRKAKQKRSQSSSQFRSQGKPIELTPLPLLKGDSLTITKCSHHNHFCSEITGALKVPDTE